MLLLPVLQYLKSTFDMSLVPLLYLGPVVALIPYVAYLLWEFNLITVDPIDQQLKYVIENQKESAKEFLREQEEQLVAKISDELSRAQPLEDVSLAELYETKKLVYARLLSQVNTEALYTEITSLKSNLQTSRGLNRVIFNRLPTSILRSILQSGGGETKKAIKIDTVTAARDLLDSIYNAKGNQANVSTKAILKELQDMEKSLDSVLPPPS
jgi:hypothetical protein